jgi:hypothetical protein
MKRRKILFRFIFLTMLVTVVFIQCSRIDDRNGNDSSTLTLLYPGDETHFGHCVYAEPRFLVFDPLLDFDSEGNFVGRLIMRSSGMMMNYIDISIKDSTLSRAKGRLG